MKAKIVILFVLISLVSCIKEDHFGASDKNDVLYFEMQNQSGFSKIDNQKNAIEVTVSADADITKLAVDSVQLSTFATMSPAKETVRDFTTPQIYSITSENGVSEKYTVTVVKEGAYPQLENSNFDAWYQPSGKSYQEPGADANTIWATANEGTSMTNIQNVSTLPYLISGTNYAAQVVTRDLGSASGLVGQRMGSGTLFVGKFVLNIQNPPLSTQFGIPFTAQPKGFAVDLKYTAGTPYLDGRGRPQNKEDQADFYVILENRDNPSAIKRIATGWIRLGTTQGNNLQAKMVDLTYGSLGSSVPDYQKPANGLYGSPSDKPTHILVVCASSADGILYEGGTNSTLYVDNFRLMY